MKIKAKPSVKNKIFIVLVTITAIFLILLIPTENIEQPKLANKKQFVWNRDSLWFSLESLYANAKKKDCSQLNNEISKSLHSINTRLDSVTKISYLPTDPIFQKIENEFFYAAALVGACSDHTENFINLFSRIRSAVKYQSHKWDLNDLPTRQTIYKLIYGGRAAVEELLLQNDKENIPPLTIGEIEKSVTPSSEILGVQIHSGDILVSRGGAPTSALIARGNDYPGNFSHVALVYIDEKTKSISIVESHIERGVVVSTGDEYLKDKKLRIMVLRLRADHPKMIEDNLLPHKAAKLLYERTLANHIPYDFEMNYNDNAKLFCSEVASAAYRQFGVNLWMGISSISSNGMANWLAGFGVKYFETQEPSDLEYDPQLTVVAEWRDAESLFKDHLDNAIIEALLEQAEKRKGLNYDWYMLPAARIFKFYSWVLNLFGSEGPVPEGMRAESALRHKRLVALHEIIIGQVELKTKDFKRENNYSAPYWRIVEFARQTIKEKKLL